MYKITGHTMSVTARPINCFTISICFTRTKEKKVELIFEKQCEKCAKHQDSTAATAKKNHEHPSNLIYFPSFFCLAKYSVMFLLLLKSIRIEMVTSYFLTFDWRNVKYILSREFKLNLVRFSCDMHFRLMQQTTKNAMQNTHNWLG